MKKFIPIVFAALLSSCTPNTTVSTVTVSYDLPHAITGIDSLAKNTGFEPADSPIQIIHGATSGNTHPDYLKGSLLTIEGHASSKRILFHFLSPGHSGTETVTLESVRFAGNKLTATYRVESPEVNTEDFAQFASSVIVKF